MHDEYLLWLNENNCWLPDLYFADADKELRFHQDIVISPESVRAQVEHDLPSTTVLNDHDIVVLYLVLSRLTMEGEDLTYTKHIPYIKILPLTIDTPLAFTEKELSLLRGTSLAFSAQRRINDTREAASRALAAVPKFSDMDEQKWLEYWRWADDIYGSRSFPGRLCGKSDGPILIPGLDSINHARGTPVTWSHDGATITLAIHQPIKKGEQVLNNYGAKSNEEFILSYGFVQPGGPDDVLVLRLRDGNVHYWKESDVQAPPALISELKEMILDEDDQLWKEARAYEILEEFLLAKRKDFKAGQREFEAYETEIRPHIAYMIREYRVGQRRLFDHAVEITRAYLEHLSDMIEEDD
ncbi:hypothetical protein MCUN1_000421 [Malassezia cuniculi]|uniref:SET domain-containing protein n=1 Tax=Malassezia cuniculi TaxID=948313 RepID=A0AAF0EVX0_9BASI|nr:hypothetical protein MCUN1_000421 [Malassezia cuniculi]